MVITIYHFPPSAPSRCALWVAKLLGLDVDVKIVDLFAKEQLKSEYIQINPQHVVPTLVDGDFTIWESRAIAAYLVSTYAKDDKLYPKNPKERALVDSRLYFDLGILYTRIRALCFPILFLGEIEIPEEKKTSFEECLGFMDIYLSENKYLAGDHLTIADISAMASLCSIITVGWNITSYDKVNQWYNTCREEIPYFQEINQAGADLFAKAVLKNLAPGQLN